MLCFRCPLPTGAILCLQTFQIGQAPLYVSNQSARLRVEQAAMVGGGAKGLAGSFDAGDQSPPQHTPGELVHPHDVTSYFCQSGRMGMVKRCTNSAYFSWGTPWSCRPMATSGGV